MPKITITDLNDFNDNLGTSPRVEFSFLKGRRIIIGDGHNHVQAYRINEVYAAVQEYVEKYQSSLNPQDKYIIANILNKLNEARITKLHSYNPFKIISLFFKQLKIFQSINREEAHASLLKKIMVDKREQQGDSVDLTKLSKDANQIKIDKDITIDEYETTTLNRTQYLSLEINQDGTSSKHPHSLFIVVDTSKVDGQYTVTRIPKLSEEDLPPNTPIRLSRKQIHSLDFNEGISKHLPNSYCHITESDYFFILVRIRLLTENDLKVRVPYRLSVLQFESLQIQDGKSKIMPGTFSVTKEEDGSVVVIRRMIATMS